MGDGALEDQVGGVALGHDPTARKARVRGPDQVDGGDVERRHEQLLRWPVGRGKSYDRVADQVDVLVVGVAREVLDLDVDAHAFAGLECLGQRGDLARQVSCGRIADEAPVGEVGVVVGHQDVIGGTSHVEFDPVGSLLERRAVGGDGVVGMVRRVATMGDHEGAGGFGAHHLRRT